MSERVALDDATETLITDDLYEISILIITQLVRCPRELQWHDDINNINNINNIN